MSEWILDQQELFFELYRCSTAAELKELCPPLLDSLMLHQQHERSTIKVIGESLAELTDGPKDLAFLKETKEAMKELLIRAFGGTTQDPVFVLLSPEEEKTRSLSLRGHSYRAETRELLTRTNDPVVERIVAFAHEVVYSVRILMEDESLYDFMAVEPIWDEMIDKGEMSNGTPAEEMISLFHESREKYESLLSNHEKALMLTKSEDRKSEIERRLNSLRSNRDELEKTIAQITPLQRAAQQLFWELAVDIPLLQTHYGGHPPLVFHELSWLRDKLFYSKTPDATKYIALADMLAHHELYSLQVLTGMSAWAKKQKLAQIERLLIRLQSLMIFEEVNA